jgi:hypothetical protein
MLSFTAIVLAGVCVASVQGVNVPNTATNSASVAAERATATPLSPRSAVKGKVFNRFVNIMMENTDFKIAQGDRKLPPLTLRT